MSTFPELIASRRQWIDSVLIPWCKSASLRDLLLAEQEWQDLAGRPAPEMTLWLWAWSRFPVLCEPGLNTLNETYPVTVVCRDGRTATGFPDARRSVAGQLILIGEGGVSLGPFPIDEIDRIEKEGFPG